MLIETDANRNANAEQLLVSEKERRLGMCCSTRGRQSDKDMRRSSDENMGHSGGLYHSENHVLNTKEAA